MWKKSYDAYWQTCRHPEDVEYILSVDERWGFNPENPPVVGPRTKVVWCKGVKTSTAGWNEAAAESSGKVIIGSADDFLPPQNWDTELLKVIPDLDSEFVIEVTSGPPHDTRRLLVIYLLSRARYERLGYLLYPEYRGLFVDNEFTEHARKDGVVIDARHLAFVHYHPAHGLGQWDAVYESQNESSHWQQGEELFKRRQAAGFPPLQKGT